MMIIAGIVLMLAPLIWSLRADIQQSLESDIIIEPSGSALHQQIEKPRIIIPKLNVDAVIIEETGNNDLDRGPVWLMGTGIPGQPGNCCIAAHKEKWFKGLKRLKAGDKVIIRIRNERHTYIVTGRKIVNANKVSVLDPTCTPTLTLITCAGPIYFGRGKGRLVVTAVLSTPKKALN